MIHGPHPPPPPYPVSPSYRGLQATSTGRGHSTLRMGAADIGRDRRPLRRDDCIVPKWVVRGLQTVFVVAVGAAFSLTGTTAVFLATGLVNISPDCVRGYLARPNLISGHVCVLPPGYGPWMVVFGVVGAVAGLLIALGALQLFSRIRSRHSRTKLAV